MNPSEEHEVVKEGYLWKRGEEQFYVQIVYSSF